MSDAVGGAVNLALIVFFIVVVALYMAFSINYQKAFNVKNKIISEFEEHNGRCDSDCMKAIKDMELSVGYGKVPLEAKDNGEHCPVGYGFCVRGVETQSSQATSSSDSSALYDGPTKKCYFEIRTQVEVTIPVINNVMGLRIFQVTGQTKALSITDPDQGCNQIAHQAT